MRTAVRKMELGVFAPRAATLEVVVASVVKGFRTVLRRISNRIAANRLNEMDDHQLADIGLTRNDLKNAFDAGLTSDPTTRLAHCARTAAAKAL
ncbi:MULTISPECIES: DUF1127 domain-containing protein [unclassified Rhizobium]|uniref:DUF1127 domain-containing protein n=1 Tax=unclassified Rhizobium TaxID=2613769 RepID=UPI001FCF95E0|nr:MULTISPECIES: DUF1127 domain-containing protein [unclassified Rhizobium]